MSESAKALRDGAFVCECPLQIGENILLRRVTCIIMYSNEEEAISNLYSGEKFFGHVRIGDCFSSDK